MIAIGKLFCAFIKTVVKFGTLSTNKLYFRDKVLIRGAGTYCDGSKFSKNSFN